MSEFFYHNGVLMAEKIAVSDMAQSVATPFYLYSRAALERAYQDLEAALHRVLLPSRVAICYSVKANSSLAVIAALGQKGAGADIVSEGELYRARAAHISPQKIIFSGVGKTATEIKAALDADIALFNVESIDELELISQIAQTRNKIAPIALRVNPNIDAATHDKITTGKAENKFGIAWQDAVAVYAHAASLPHINPCGLDIHIGSQITSLAPFRASFVRLAELVVDLRAGGYEVSRLDIGGGVGVAYERAPDFSLDEYAAAIGDTLGELDCSIIVEPGRMLVAAAGLLITRLIRIKQTAHKNFAIIDAAMNDFVRPTLYNAWHDIKPITQSKEADLLVWDVVGPICETGDYLGLARKLPLFSRGDLLAIFMAGAYGAVQASMYNSRLLVPEIMVDGGDFTITRPRPSYEAMLAAETLPSNFEL